MWIQTYGDPQKISIWRAGTYSALSTQLVATAGPRDQLDFARQELLKQLQAQRVAQDLSPIKTFPLEPVRNKQASDIQDCVRPKPWDLLPKRHDLSNIVETHLMLGTVIRHRVIGAFVILESMINSIIAETAALGGKWFGVDGTWDSDQGNIGEIMSSLDSVVAMETPS